MAVELHDSGAEVVLAHDRPIRKAVTGTDHECASWTISNILGGQLTPA